MAVVPSSSVASRQAAGRTRGPARRWPVQGAWLLLGTAALVLAVGWTIRADLGVVPVMLFLLLPDLAFLASGGGQTERGQLAARAVPVYNASHRTVGPVAVLAVALLGGTPAWIVAGLAWLAHVALDRGFGFGLRTPDGWQRV